MIKKLKIIAKITVFSFLVIGLIGTNALAFQGPVENNEKVDVLIGFHQAPGLSERNMVRGHGGEIYREFTIVNVIAARITLQAANSLAQNPGVRYVEADGPVYALDQEVPWGIDRVFGDESYSFETWGITRGDGIAVAILDTGIDENHEDLPVLLGGVNTIDSTHWGSDGSGHGTHVAGTAAALDNELGVVGVGPQIGLYAVKVLSDGGSGTVGSVIAGIEWAAEQGIPILNMSLGTGTHYQTLQDACDVAYSAGHLLVSSAGNSGNPPGRGDNVGYPAAYDSVVAVAASDSGDRRASFSSTGPAVELIAPGASIKSTLPGNSYGTYSGTSMASPHVAGVAALAWASNPSLTNLQMREVLQQTAEDLGLSVNHQGYGLVRADLAVRAVAEVEPPTTYVITATADDGGTIEPSGEVEVYEGDNQTFNITPNSGYKISDVVVDGGSVGAKKSHTFENVANNHTIHAVFEAVPVYTVSGRVTDDGDSPLRGATVTIEKTGQEGTTDEDGAYSISDVEEGAYNITASKSGYSSQTETVMVESNTTVDFVLEEVTIADVVRVESITYSTRGGRLDDRHLDITLLLLDDMDQSVADASVSATLHRNGSSWNFRGTTNSNGTVTFSLLNHGSGCYHTEVTAVEAEGFEWDGVTQENSYCK